MNVSLLNVGLPTLARQLGATNSDLEWIVEGYSLVFAGFLMAAGALGDRFGGRPVILAGLGVFGLGSVYSAMASSSVELIVGRSVTGLGGALVAPMTLSVMREVFPKVVDLRRAIGIWASTASAGAVVAPLVAGLLLGAFWWGSLFLANVPLDVVMIVAVWLTVPDPKGRASTRFDWGGAGLSVVLSCSAVFALIEGPSLGWSHPIGAGSLGAIVLSGAGFWFWERRSPAPLVDLSCFAERRFSVGSGLPTARRSLASALTSTGRSDVGYGLLVSASRQAFMSGLYLAVWIATGMAFGSAASVWVALRPTRAEVPAPLPAAGATQIS